VGHGPLVGYKESFDGQSLVLLKLSACYQLYVQISVFQPFFAPRPTIATHYNATIPSKTRIRQM